MSMSDHEERRRPAGQPAPRTPTGGPVPECAGPSASAAADVDAERGPDLAHELIRTLTERSLTIATCESLTGGGLCSALTDVPGASSVVRGGLVTYATDLKVSLAGVDAAWVADHGVINEQTAVAMATGSLRATRSSVAVSCTGVAGPTGQDGHDPGDVWLAVAMADGTEVPEVIVTSRHLHLPGDRSQVRTATIEAAIRLVLDHVG